MQLARQTQDAVAHRPSEQRQDDFTPSGIFPVGRRGRALIDRSDDEPFIVVHELSDIEAAQVALLEQGLEDEAWEQEEAANDDSPDLDYENEQDHTFELAPVTVDAKLPIVGDDWQEDEETTRFMRGVPVLLPRAFGRAELRMARDLAQDLALAASSPGIPDPFDSPWRRTAAMGPSLATTPDPPERTWRDWLLIAALTFAAEGALLGAIAWALG